MRLSTTPTILLLAALLLPWAAAGSPSVDHALLTEEESCEDYAESDSGSTSDANHERTWTSEREGTRCASHETWAGASASNNGSTLVRAEVADERSSDVYDYSWSENSSRTWACGDGSTCSETSNESERGHGGESNWSRYVEVETAATGTHRHDLEGCRSEGRGGWYESSRESTTEDGTTWTHASGTRDQGSSDCERIWAWQSCETQYRSEYRNGWSSEGRDHSLQQDRADDCRAVDESVTVTGTGTLLDGSYASAAAGYRTTTSTRCDYSDEGNDCARDDDARLILDVDAEVLLPHPRDVAAWLP